MGGKPKMWNVNALTQNIGALAHCTPKMWRKFAAICKKLSVATLELFMGQFHDKNYYKMAKTQVG